MDETTEQQHPYAKRARVEENNTEQQCTSHNGICSKINGKTLIDPPGRKRSDYWKYYYVYADDQGDKAVCKVCHQEINTKTCSSGLSRHLKQHEAKSEELKNNVEQLKNAKKDKLLKSLGASKKESPEVVKQKFTECAAAWVVEENRRDSGVLLLKLW